jgi:FkbM family methyltransferase
MIDLFSRPPETTFERLLRLPLKLVPKSAVVPVLRGPLAGLWWIAGSGIHRCWLGFYELPKQKRFAACIGPGMTVYDIGANTGIYTLLAARRVGTAGQVHAFEPLPENLAFLRRHVELNHFEQVRIHSEAVSEKAGVLRFARGSDRFVGRIDRQGELEVQTDCLDEFIARGSGSAPDVIKVDVEGAEIQVLRGSRELLASKHPVIFLATHGRSIHQECCEMLTSLHYRLEGLTGESASQADELVCLPS